METNQELKPSGFAANTHRLRRIASHRLLSRLRRGVAKVAEVTKVTVAAHNSYSAAL